VESVVLVHSREGGRFCEVTWEGLHVEIVEGAEGNEDVTQRTFVSPAEAREFVTDLLAERRADGYSEGKLTLEDLPSEATDEFETLVAHAAADLDDEARLLVLADWLQQRGLPRGQLIAFQHAHARDPSDETRARVDELVLSFREQLYGDLAEQVDLVNVSFRLGFAERAHLFARDPETVALDARSLTTGFLTHPTCRLLRRLVLALPDGVRADEVIAGAVRAQPMRTVHSLQLGAPDDSATFSVPAALTRVFPGLTELAVFGDDVTFEAATYDALRTLILWGRLDHAASAFTQCDFPALKRLAFGGARYDDDGLRHTSIGDALLAARLDRKLEVLDLDFGGANTATLEGWIRTHASRLARISSLVLSGNPANVAAIAPVLAAAGAKVTIAAQRLAKAYAIEDLSEELASGEDDEDDDEYEGYVFGEDAEAPESEKEEDDGQAEREEEREEPGVDEGWEAPKEAPFDIDDDELEKETPDDALEEP